MTLEKSLLNFSRVKLEYYYDKIRSCSLNCQSSHVTIEEKRDISIFEFTTMSSLNKLQKKTDSNVTKNT